MNNNMVSVIICNHNGEKFIENCLDSVFNQSYPSFEVIVIDNASTDNSLAILKEFNAIVLKNSKSVGPAVARNQGAKIAIGGYLAFFDNDTILDKHCLYFMKNTLLAYDASMCQAKILRMGTSNFDCAGDNIGEFGFLVGRTGAVEDRGQLDFVAPIISLKTAACMVRKKDFKGFNEKYYMYLEDTDLSWRLWNKGKSVVFAYQAKVWHAYDTPFKGKKYYDPKVVRYNGCRNYIWTIARNSDGLLFKHVTCWVGIGLLFALKLKFKDAYWIFKGIIDALKTLPKREGNYKTPIVKQSFLSYFKKVVKYV